MFGKIKNKKYKSKIKKIAPLFNTLPKENQKMILLIFYRFKKHAPDEYYLYFALLYGLLFFGKIDLTFKGLTIEDIRYLSLFREIHKMENIGDSEGYLKNTFLLPEELRKLRLLIKYTILSTPNYSKIISNYDNYLRSIGWIIPWVSYKKCSKLERFFQKIYFKELYPREFLLSSKKYSKQIDGMGIKGLNKLLVSFSNTLFSMFLEENLYTMHSVRKKTLFSFYNKLKRKGKDYICSDLFGAKIIFKNEKDLNRFFVKIKNNYKLQEIKNHAKGRASGYKAIHCIIIYTFANKLIPIEIQLKTRKWEKESSEGVLSHFNYSLRNKKWDKEFVEIHEGIEVLQRLKLLEKA